MSDVVDVGQEIAELPHEQFARLRDVIHGRARADLRQQKPAYFDWLDRKAGEARNPEDAESIIEQMRMRPLEPGVQRLARWRDLVVRLNAVANARSDLAVHLHMAVYPRAQDPDGNQARLSFQCAVIAFESLREQSEDLCKAVVRRGMAASSHRSSVEARVMEHFDGMSVEPLRDKFAHALPVSITGDNQGWMLFLHEQAGTRERVPEIRRMDWRELATELEKVTSVLINALESAFGDLLEIVERDWDVLPNRTGSKPHSAG